MRLVLWLALLGGACASPTAPDLPACQVNHTGEVTVRNASQSMQAYDVRIDDVPYGAVAFGQTVGSFSLPAGVNHLVVLRLANTTTIACQETILFTQCAAHAVVCSGA